MLEMLHPHLACDELSVAITLALPPKQPRLRVLCCHGYAGGARRFETKTAKALLAHPCIADLLDVAAVDGPHAVDAPHQRAHWLYDPPFPLSERDRQPAFWALAEAEYVGADEGIASLAAAWHADRFDGILGFSQGAGAAALLAATLERAAATRPPKFLVLCAGFRDPRPSNPALGWWRNAPDAALATPALVLVGDRDTQTPERQARALAALFRDATVRVCAGLQHAMPTRAQDIEAVASFLRNYLQ